MSVTPTEVTIEILKEIRDEIRDSKESLSSRIDATNERLDNLERRQTETEIRLATEIISVAGAVREVKDLLADRLDLRDRVDDHERRISALESEQ